MWAILLAAGLLSAEALDGCGAECEPPVRRPVDFAVLVEFAPIGDINIGNVVTPRKSVMVGLAAEGGYTTWFGDFGIRAGLAVEPLYMPSENTPFALRISALPGLRFALGRWVLGADWAPAFVTSSAHTGLEVIGAQLVAVAPGTPRLRLTLFIHTDVIKGQLCDGCEAGPENLGVSAGIGF